MGQQVGVGGAADEPTGAETAGDGGCPVRGLRVGPAGVAWRGANRIAEEISIAAEACLTQGNQPACCLPHNIIASSISTRLLQ